MLWPFEGLRRCQRGSGKVRVKKSWRGDKGRRYWWAAQSSQQVPANLGQPPSHVVPRNHLRRDWKLKDHRLTCCLPLPFGVSRLACQMCWGRVTEPRSFGVSTHGDPTYLDRGDTLLGGVRLKLSLNSLLSFGANAGLEAATDASEGSWMEL